MHSRLANQDRTQNPEKKFELIKKIQNLPQKKRVLGVKF